MQLPVPSSYCKNKKVNAYAVRSKFEARFQYLVLAAAQYASPALTVLLSLALLVHSGSGIDANVHYPDAHLDTLAPSVSSGLGFPSDVARVHSPSSLGICDAARLIVGAHPWKQVVMATAAAARREEDILGRGEATGSKREGDAFSVSVGDDGYGSSGGGVKAREAERNGDGVEEEGTGSTEGGVMAKFFNVPSLPEAFWYGVMGFLAWWASLSWAITYAIGVLFWRLFPEDESVEERAPRDRTTKAKRDKENRGKGRGKVKVGGSRKGTA